MAALVALTGCGPSLLDQHETCELELSTEAPEAAPGDTVVLTGGPQTRAYDTRVEVGGIPAEVVEVTRSTECSSCDDCRVEAECLACGYCAGEILEETRRAQCFGDPFAGTGGVCGDCVETVSFVMPELPPGPTTVVVLNANGASEPQAFVVRATEPTVPTAETGLAGPTGDTAITPTTPPTGDTGPTVPSPTGGTGRATADTGLLTGDTGGFATGDTGTTTTPPLDTADTAPTADTASPATGTTADTGPTADTAPPPPTDTVDTGL